MLEEHVAVKWHGGGDVTAKIIHLASSGTKAWAYTDIRLPDSLGFMSTCPNCKDVRSQQIYGFRTLVRFLVDNQPIEAYCADCKEFWPITANERAELACLLLH
jgi:hypothetical protein